jgi:hypothetical protein
MRTGFVIPKAFAIAAAFALLACDQPQLPPPVETPVTVEFTSPVPPQQAQRAGPAPAPSPENTLERLRAQQAQQQPPTGTARLTQGEIRGLAEQIGECFSVDANLLPLDVVVEVRVQLDRQGNVINVVPSDRGVPSDPHSLALYESVRRALLSPQCNPLRVPPDKHSTIMASIFRFGPQGTSARARSGSGQRVEAD